MSAAASRKHRVAIVGGGPAGLMAAEIAIGAGLDVDVYEGKGSVGRRFLIAGKGGLNLTHSENTARFVDRYGRRRTEVGRWLSSFDADALRRWARELGIETFIGTSGRVFPADLKAAPLLRRWVRRLREQGVQFHVHHYCIGLVADRTLRLRTPTAVRDVRADAIVLALGGASWPELGADGQWVSWLASQGVPVARMQPSNCGFDVDWSALFSQRYAGQPLKSVRAGMQGEDGDVRWRQGELVITANGIEGSLVYVFSPPLRDEIERRGHARLYLDLVPDRELGRLQVDLSRPGRGRSLSERLRRARIEGVKAGLLYEVLDKADRTQPDRIAATIKSLPLTLLRPRPIAEAISSAGGVHFEALNENLMLECLPGVHCAGEMIDWEAPTGGYLLTACFASGQVAGSGVVEWLKRNAATG